jgi:hypothetical protein
MLEAEAKEIPKEIFKRAIAYAHTQASIELLKDRGEGESNRIQFFFFF